MNILGIHDGHDAGAALVTDGKLVANVKEYSGSESGNRIGFPYKSIARIFRENRISPKNLDAVVLPRIWGTPFLSDPSVNSDPAIGFFNLLLPVLSKFNGFLSEAEYRIPSAGMIRRNLYSVIFKYTGTKTVRQIRKLIANQTGINDNRIAQCEHHTAHAAAAYCLSPYQNRRVAVLTADGEGDLVSASVNVVSDGDIECLARSPVSSSLGYMYMETTSFLGLKRNRDERLVMEMAEKYKMSDKKYRKYQKVLEKLSTLIFRKSNEPLVFRSVFDMRLLGYFLRDNFIDMPPDLLAAAVQKVLEKKISGWVKDTVRIANVDTVCFGGGVGLNTKAMRTIAKLPEIRDLFVCPDAGDGSLATGAAYSGYLMLCGRYGPKSRP